ncbi:RNA dependent RNA polymerase-domain-containing protein [Massariosphaeria phaeospora]|uniref:RNA dependent RNA polymerase-domain-containing protein n=1 Tax=Massariosphaeria phaeospora TaxID=100035 RepID=A0A7C8MIZ3_9PLEO|nr:RNA dependent RNA polymerase-domain-containing protein [Massariosphaeria phaeospora]
MGTPRSFRAVLQDSIDPDAVSWSYHVPNLPQPQQTNSAGVIKCVSVVCSETRQEITLHFANPPANRVTRGAVLDNFVLISFADFRLRWPPSAAGDSARLATRRENADYITRLLTTGITLNGTQYNFFGHSNSQLKSRSCFLFGASKEVIAAKIEAMGDLSKLKSVGKKAKRIGLLFSSAEMALTLQPDRCEDIDDIKYNDYIFTDGCGLISEQLAKQLVQRQNIVFRGKRYLPSVYQIRYRGYKGVLTLDKTLHGQILILFRHSMRKFKDASDLSFSVVDYARPYAFGYLNDEVIVLLRTLGISQETLLKKQDQHLQFLLNVRRGDCRAAFQFLSYCDRLDLAEKLLFSGIEVVTDTLKSLVKQEYTRMLNKREEQRCRILIPKSRLLFGVCDPFSKNGQHGKLKEGECFVRITLDGDGNPATIVDTEVLVTRNPCLHPGDLQKFKAVNIPELSHLVDCIVFSTRGKRPSADLMSGGDLDGDKFFVTWDRDIIPRTISEPAQYVGGKESIEFAEITGDVRARYFAQYTNASLGQVKNLYMKWTRLATDNKAMSSQSQELNRLFSLCVDGNFVRIPERLKDPPEPSPTAPPFILDVLHEASTNHIGSVANRSLALFTDSPPDIMDLFLSRDMVAINEFELVQLALRWCDRNAVDIMTYSHLFNFSALSDEQQICFLGRLPPSATAPSLVRNGLLQSELMDHRELSRFGLDHPRLRWKPVFSSATERMGRFTGVMCHSLEAFHKKLIILKLDERLTLAIYVPQKIEKDSEVQVKANVRVFALPTSKGSYSPSYRVVPTSVNYKLYCDEHHFQLYDLKRGNTWIQIVQSHFDDTLYRNEKNLGDRRRLKQHTVDEGLNFDCKISVALQKISEDISLHVGRVNKQGIEGAEIYVISNRDVQSMRVSDQWLHFVDTEEVLPLFERLETDYKVTKLDDITWDTYSDIVKAIALDRNLAHLRLLSSVEDLESVFTLLSTHGERRYLRDVYAHILSLEASSSCSLDGRTVASTLLDYLPEATYLIPTFLQSQTWQTYKPVLEETLVHLAPTLLRELVLATNELAGFVRYPLSLLLKELKRIALQQFAELVELVALTVRSSEAALDLLLGLFEPETPRLLIGRPVAIRQFVSALYGIALDHIDEASNNGKPERESLKLAVDDHKDGFTIVESTLRVDSSLGGILKVGDHVRLTVTNPPQNAPLAKPFSMDALVLKAETGTATFRCLHTPPAYIDQCAWAISQCGSFVTSKTSFDAVMTFYTKHEACCRIYPLLAGLPDSRQIELPDVELPVTVDDTLNSSQNAALAAAMKHSLTFIWGPPGTGKTHTVVVILTQLLMALPQSRFLVTAPTHNAVDNMLRRFIRDDGVKKSGVIPVRVSTQLAKVSPDLRSYTCDAMLGKDISANFPARRKALKRIKEARLIFTTCIGASLGLLRTENFGVVLVDEASQQTEPATLVPLVKGCSRAILVGDHVQLRATVQKNAVLTGYDISLFERHYNLPERKGVAKAMLDTQYRMHRDICDFSSTEFYEGRLNTAVLDAERPLPASQFPWPDGRRMAWVECATNEDLGKQSKTNQGQVDVCKTVIRLLTTPPANAAPGPANPPPPPQPTIAILTPYTRQKELLAASIPNIEVSSIDGFQGREADIIVFVTVRCNVHCDMGFLTDMRRLNVVMTRAKTAVVVVGNKATLTGAMVGGEGEEEEESWRVWKRLGGRCGVVRELTRSG